MRYLSIVSLGVLLFCGCVRMSEVEADTLYRSQAQTALTAGNYSRARYFIAKADQVNVPRTRLARRTLDMQIAVAENVQHGELARLQKEWLAQRRDWSLAERVDAELTMIATLQPEYAIDQLYDMDPYRWPTALRTRYNLLFAQLLMGKPALYDVSITKWANGIKGIYDTQTVSAAAEEAERCARLTHCAPIASMAAKLYNELGRADKKAEMISLARAWSADTQVTDELLQIESAPLYSKCQL